jgi:hypothetical protein
MAVDGQGDFSVGGFAPTTLASGNSLTVPVTFAPLSVGQHAATLTINSTAGVMQIKLEGFGVLSAGVESSLSACGFMLTPNPAQNVLRIAFQDASQTGCILRIYDIEGKTHSTRSLALGSLHTEVDVSMLPNGSYYLEMKTGEALETHRFVIAR